MGSNEVTTTVLYRKLNEEAYSFTFFALSSVVLAKNIFLGSDVKAASV